MINIKNKHIEFSRGDSGSLVFKFSRNITSSETVVFTVKKHLSGEKMFVPKKIVGTGSDTVTVNLTKTDTNIPVGTYFYDVRIIEGNTVTTPFKPRRFTVLASIGDNTL